MTTREAGTAARRAVPAAAAAAPRRGGRPPLLSREMVLQAALDLAHEMPETPLSISAIARRLRVTPMALYTYFSNRDALMQAVSAHLLDGFVVDLPAAAAPVDRIMLWADAMRDYCLAHPELMLMLVWEGGQSSSAWFERSRPLLDAVSELGQTGDAHGRTMLWLWNSILSGIKLEAFLQKTQLDRCEATAAEAGEGAHGASRSPEPKGSHAEYFSFHMEQLAHALAAMARA